MCQRQGRDHKGWLDKPVDCMLVSFDIARGAHLCTDTRETSYKTRLKLANRQMLRRENTKYAHRTQHFSVYPCRRERDTGNSQNVSTEDDEAHHTYTYGEPTLYSTPEGGRPRLVNLLVLGSNTLPLKIRESTTACAGRQRTSQNTE